MKRPREQPAFRPPLTPLIDIAFLVLIFFMALPMKSLDHKLQAHLPEHGHRAEYTVRPPPEKVSIRVLWRDGRHLFRLGDQVHERVEGMERTLRLLGPDNVYQVHSDIRASFQAVIDVVNLLVGLEYDDVEFRGCIPPSSVQRRAIPMLKPG